jgi:hypothetical protein
MQMLVHRFVALLSRGAPRALFGLALCVLGREAHAGAAGDRLRVELSPAAVRVASVGGARHVDWSLAAGWHRREERVWIEGRHEEHFEEVWVEAREVRVHVPAEHRIVRDACGRERLVLVRPAHWRVECIPGRFETVVRRVWVPGRWEWRHRPWSAATKPRC